jgi:hypothetical protein
MIFALLQPNPASHLIWLVALVAGGVLALFVLYELGERAVGALRRRLGGGEEAPAGPDDGVRLAEPDTELRARHHHRVEPARRTWSEGRVNQPAERR